MACPCTDRLNDLSDKFDLILELVNTVLELVRKRLAITPPSGGGGGGGYYSTEPSRYWDKQLHEYETKKLLEAEGKDLMELIEIICVSGVLDD